MIAWACIAPHGGAIVPELADGDLALMQATRAAMEELGRRARAAAPETIVIYTPHGICAEGHLCVSVATAAVGLLEGPNGRIAAAHPVDLEAAAAIAEEASALGVPVALAAFDSANRPVEVLPMDFGALIPLWYMGARWEERPRLVLVCPDRSLSRRQLVNSGLATAEAAERVGRRVALICSADHGHGHREDGPYGYSAHSASYDRAFCAAVRDNELRRLLYWRNDWIEKAMPDSYWQALMLHGALGAARYESELLSYEAPTYFGMACAAFARSGGAEAPLAQVTV